MIYGIGTDIVQISRMAKKWQRSGDDFARAILSPQEWDDYSKCKDTQKAAFLSKRFAAKEAFAKALRTGFRQPIFLNNISILHNEHNAPYFALTDELQQWLNDKNIKNLHLSISDEKDYAMAFVVAEE
ncbi:MAG: holo-ACP synthase [Neisseriaceae bacterium]|nr:holo-ACP synthase [Neisseriaceae bacterium]